MTGSGYMVLNGTSLGKPCRVCQMTIHDDEDYWSFIDQSKEFTFRVHAHCEPYYIGLVRGREYVQKQARR